MCRGTGDIILRASKGDCKWKANLSATVWLYERLACSTAVVATPGRSMEVAGKKRAGKKKGQGDVSRFRKWRVSEFAGGRVADYPCLTNWIA
jgi:hypothetical protein